MLSNSFDTLVHELPDAWTAASVRIDFERESGELGRAQVEKRASASEELGWLGARETPDGVSLEMTPATAVVAARAVRALEDGGRLGRVTVRSVTCPDRYDLQTWQNAPEHLRRAKPVQVGSGYEVAA